MTDDLTSKSATELVQLIKARDVSSVEVAQAFLRRIEDLNPSLNAIVTIAPYVLDHAREGDAELKSGRSSGPLHGLPITIKDTIDTEGIRTTYGSQLFAEHVPRKDATVVAKLKSAGAIILGKTNVPEMAIPYETDNPVFGRTNNPHDLNYTSGGSSGGEAAAIAARLSPAGIGSDLSGSIRVPAHFCGIAGLKPTTAAVPMEGHVPSAAGVVSLGSCIGPMASRVVDLALLFSVMAQHPQGLFLDEVISRLPKTSVAYFTGGDVAGNDEVGGAVGSAANLLRDAGLDVREDRPPAIAEASRLWIELFSGATRQQLREIYRGREEQAGPLVSNLIENGSELGLAEKIEKAEKVARAVVERERLREELLRWLRHTPLILSPVSATAAFKHGAPRVTVNVESISIFRSCSFSHAANVFGLPAVAVPVGRTSDGLPIGVQLMSGPVDERRVLAAAAIIERGARFS